MISQPTIQQIKQRADIVDIISEVVVLKRRGTNHVGLCPFHNERTPSFSVSQSKQIYKCFGCGRSGSVITFLMEYQKYSYVESLRQLATRYGIEVEEVQLSQDEKRTVKQSDSLAAFNKFARDFFHHQLYHTEEGKLIGLPYLHERGYLDETIKKFGLGYNPNQPQALLDESRKQQFDDEIILASGTVLQRNGRYVDAYQGRIIFPIYHHAYSKVMGFAARALKKTSSPKYVNTQQNALYNKGQTLYGLLQAKDAIIKSQQAILVEGYTDVLTLCQARCSNVVASSGTALTKEQAGLLHKYTKRVLLLYDGDQAGINAAIRGISVMIEQGLDIEVLSIPDKADPDEYIATHGEAHFHELLALQKRSFIDFLVDTLIPPNSTIVEKDAGITQIAETLSNFHHTQDIIKKQEYIKYCAQKADVDQNSLNRLVNIHIRNRIRKAEQKVALDQPHYLDPTTKKDARPLSQVDKKSRDTPGKLKNEIQLISVLVNHGAKTWEDKQKVAHYIIDYLEQNNLLHEIKNLHIKEMLSEYKEQANQDVFLDNMHFIYHENEGVRELAIQVSKTPPSPNPKWNDIITDYQEDQKYYYKKEVKTTLCLLSIKMIQSLIKDNQRWQEENQNEDDKLFLDTHNILKSWQKKIAQQMGIVILKS